jgi:hypothetical protein
MELKMADLTDGMMALKRADSLVGLKVVKMVA